MDSPEAYFSKRTATTPNGRSIVLTFKTTIFDDEVVTWELRGVLAALGYTSQENVKYVRKSKLPLVTAVASTMGLDLGEMVILSRKAAKTIGIHAEQHAEYRYVQQEFTMHTKHVLYLLALGLKTTSGDKKDYALGVWRSFCEQFLGSTVLASPVLQDCRMVPGQHCLGGVVDGMCSHVLRVCEVVGKWDDSIASPQSVFATLVERIVDGDIACPHVGVWVSNLFDSLLAPIHDNVVKSGDQNALSAATALFGPKKRRRMDEHMKDAIVKRVKSEGLAPNGPSWARATGNANPKSMDRVRDGHLFAYAMAQKQSFEGCFTIKLALDGARLGEPKEEFFVAIVENCDTGVASWCAPAVP